MPVKDWSTTASSNTTEFPELQLPSTVNNGMRTVQADLRSVFDDLQWFDAGHSPAHASSTTFTVATDLTGTYDVGRRLKITDATTIYATITASTYSAPDTTVTVVTDTGSLSASLTTVALGVLSGTNQSMPAGTLPGNVTINNSAAATVVTLNADTGNDTAIRFEENSVLRGFAIYDESADEFNLRKYDTNGTTIKANLTLKNTGDVDVTTGTLKQGGKEALINNGNAYHGRVNSNGTTISGNSGFSGTRPGTGEYLLDTGFGNVNFTAIVSVSSGATARFIEGTTDGVDDLRVHTFNSSGVAANSAWTFIIIPD